MKKNASQLWLVIPIIAMPVFLWQAVPISIYLVFGFAAFNLPFLRDDILTTYVVGGMILLVCLSLLAAWGAKKLAEFLSIPVWVTGPLFIFVIWWILPVLQFFFALMLVLILGMF